MNRICIVVPCHRIVGSSGDLTGYSGGVDAKRFLLELEGRLPEKKEAPGSTSATASRHGPLRGRRRRS